MKTNLLKITAILLILAGSFSCGKDDENSSIIGKWKLMKAEIPYSERQPSYDYSQRNIIYEFKANGNLIVFGKTNNINHYLGHEQGVFEFSYINDSDESRMKIDNTTWWYVLSAKELILSLAPLDGQILYFVKL
jgi:hypothetical protein